MNKTIEIKYSENGLMTEDSFKEVWQSGAYHNIYMSPAEYIQFIHTYVEEYGLPFDKDTKLYRASSSGEENESSLSGGSWTTSIDDAFLSNLNHIGYVNILMGANLLLTFFNNYL